MKKKKFRIARGIGVSFLLLLISISVFLRVRYGGGIPYPDITGDPILQEQDLEPFFSYPEPLGNVAASNDTNSTTRVFFTVHPESRPQGNKLLEIVNGKAVPYPNLTYQDSFVTLLGVFCDRQKRLWTIDHGNHGFGDVCLSAFDLNSNKQVEKYIFSGEVAEKLSFFNDLSVSPDGRYVFVADVSFFGKKPSLVVFDTYERKARSLLDGHPSVQNKGFVPITPLKKMRFLGGLVDLIPGIDGLDISHDGAYVYYAAMSHDSLYRLPLSVATDFTLSKLAIASAVEAVCPKPLSDGIRCDTAGNVHITDIEHGGFSIYTQQGTLKTLLKDKRVRWADGASLGGDQYMYFTDSAIPDQMLRSKKHMKKSAPYSIFRYRPPYAEL